MTRTSDAIGTSPVKIAIVSIPVSWKPGTDCDTTRHAVGGNWSHITIDDAEDVVVVLGKWRAKIVVGFIALSAAISNETWDKARIPKRRIMFTLSDECYPPEVLIGADTLRMLEEKYARWTKPAIAEVPRSMLPNNSVIRGVQIPPS